MFRLRHLVTARALPVLVFLLLGLAGCSGHGVKAKMDPADRLELADRLRSEENCVHAIEQYEKLLSEFPTPQVAERARFNLAACHLEMRHYQVARAEFEDFIDSYPRSEFVDNALYMVGLSYMRAAPRPERDQTQTVKALSELTLLLREYPDSDVREAAEGAVAECRSRLAEKEYLAGRLYLNMKNYRAARVYFDSVLETYGDTPWAPRALLLKGRSYVRQGQYENAKAAFEQVVAGFPGSDASDEAAGEMRELEHVRSGGEEDDPEE
jgi:outer membrane protein assembly factor BamD